VLAALTLVAVFGVWSWYFDAADVPNPSNKRAILAIECHAWNGLPGNYQSNLGMIVVQRNAFAAVTTFVDMKNLALYREAAGRWVRVTQNGWLHEYDKSAFWKAGVPLLDGNALVNGLRREYRRWNPHTEEMAHC
jgi:hypothetical protein